MVKSDNIELFSNHTCNVHSFLLAAYIWKSKKYFFNLEKKIKKITMIFRYIFLGAGVGAGAPRNTHKKRTQCGCKCGYKNDGSL